MVSIGGSNDTVIEMEGLGFRGRYTSGTLVWTSCHMHLHAVSESQDAERVGFAAYVTPSVQQNNKLGRPGPPIWQHVNEIHMSEIQTRQ